MRRNEEDEPWAEVAKFNKLLEIRSKLDEVGQNKRRANMQRAYLDQQLQIRADKDMAAKRDKIIQHQRMTNLIDQVSRDRMDNQNRECM